MISRDFAEIRCLQLVCTRWYSKTRVYLFESTGDSLALVKAETTRLRLNEFHPSVQ